jgi:hypothetical protein
VLSLHGTEENMKIKVLIILVCLLFLLPVFSFATVADPGPKLEITILGCLPLPKFSNYVGGVIGNTGDAPAYNISIKLTMLGGFGGTISETIQGDTNIIAPGTGYAVGISDAFGFGPVTITLTASAENAENATGTAHGYQYRGFTWVPFSWLSAISKG